MQKLYVIDYIWYEIKIIILNKTNKYNVLKQNFKNIKIKIKIETKNKPKNNSKF